MSIFFYFDRYKITANSRLSLLLNHKKYKQFLHNYKYAFNEKVGLEIGGPSKLFSTSIFPIYDWAQNIDGCNFSNNTIVSHIKVSGTVKGQQSRVSEI